MDNQSKRNDTFLNLDLSGLNEGARGLLDIVPEIIFKHDLGELIAQRGLTQAEVSQITGIRQATISDMVNNRRASISIPHMVVLMIALKIPRLSDIIDITFDTETVEKFEKESIDWVSEKNIPLDRRELIIKQIMSKK